MVALSYFVFLITAIYAISKSSDLLIDTASSLGRKLHLKDYFIGSLIVGVGTSLPELMTSVAAVGEGAAGLVAPTVYGTIIANIGAGLGLAVIGLYCFVGRSGRIRIVDLGNPYGGGAVMLSSGSGAEKSEPFGTAIVFAAFSVLLSYLLCLDGVFSRIDAALFILGYLAFITNEFVSRSKPQVQAVAPRQTSATPVTEAVAPPVPAADPTEAIAGSGKTAFSALVDAIRIVGGLMATFLVFALTWDSSPFNRLDTLALFLFGMAGILVFQTVFWWSWLRHPRSVPYARFAATILRRLSKSVLVIYLGFSLIVVFFSGSIIVKSVLVLAEQLRVGSTVLAASAIAVGTSLPDIVVAIKVARKGRHMLLIGHILQSNIFDVFLIMGLCGIFVPLPVDNPTARIAILFATALTISLIPVFRARSIRLPEGILLFLAFLAFIVVLF